MPGLRPRGGIEIVEVAETRGSPEISTVMTITSLDDAAGFRPSAPSAPYPKRCLGRGLPKSPPPRPLDGPEIKPRHDCGADVGRRRGPRSRRRRRRAGCSGWEVSRRAAAASNWRRWCHSCQRSRRIASSPWRAAYSATGPAFRHLSPARSLGNGASGSVVPAKFFVSARDRGA